MSRSFDSRSLTTRPSMRISPAEISSSPASIRSSVLLPHPDGPTSTTNSPSTISMLTPCTTWVLPKLFLTLRNATDAMISHSTLYGAGRQARHHVALEGVIDGRRRQRVDQPGRH